MNMDNVIGSSGGVMLLSARLPLDLSWPHYYPSCLGVVYDFVERGQLDHLEAAGQP